MKIVLYFIILIFSIRHWHKTKNKGLFGWMIIIYILWGFWMVSENENCIQTFWNAC